MHKFGHIFGFWSEKKPGAPERLRYSLGSPVPTKRGLTSMKLKTSLFLILGLFTTGSLVGQDQVLLGRMELTKTDLDSFNSREVTMATLDYKQEESASIFPSEMNMVKYCFWWSGYGF